MLDEKAQMGPNLLNEVGKRPVVYAHTIIPFLGTADKVVTDSAHAAPWNLIRQTANRNKNG